MKHTLLAPPSSPTREVVVADRAAEDGAAAGCGDCRTGEAIGFDFTFAFQPIVDAPSRKVFSYEALVRGPGGESAPSILAKVNDGNRYRFDQACRVKALTLAAQLGMETKLNINFLPNAVYRPEACIRATLAAARRVNFPTERIVFEVTEGENVLDINHLLGIFKEYSRLGFATAIDDFGAGYAGLNLLANYQPDYIKLDMDLLRGIDLRPARQAIVRAMIAVCRELSISIVAEGVETEDEYAWLFRHGIDLFQGYLFARPAFEALPLAAIPVVERSAVHPGRRLLRHARPARTA
jgi:EAL domain-containing protein (putative c-di-GMP-specific phosphodiesterase class I)